MQSRVEKLVLHVVQVLQLIEYCFFNRQFCSVAYHLVVRDVPRLICALLVIMHVTHYFK